MKRIGHVLDNPQAVMQWLAGDNKRTVRNTSGRLMGFYALDGKWCYRERPRGVPICLADDAGPWIQIEDEIGPLESLEVVEELPAALEAMVAGFEKRTGESCVITRDLLAGIMAWARAEFGGKS